MKKISKLLVTLIFALIIVSSAVVPAFAATVPAQVKNLKASSITYSSVKLTWSKASNSNKYYIERYTPSTKKWTNLANTKNTNYTATGLTTGVSYKFRVRGYRTINRKYGKYSTAITVKPMPVKTTGLKVSSKTPTSATLAWTAVAGATGYTVQQYKSSKWVKASTVTKNTATIKNLVPNSTNKFRVAAYTTVSKKNYSGAYSAELSVATTIAQVTGVKVTQKTPVSATVTWTKVTGATSYKVYNGTKLLKTVTTNSATIGSLVPGTSYSINVKAVVTVSKKDYLGKASANVAFKPTLAAVTGLKASAVSKDSVTITWTASKTAGISGYYIYKGSSKVATVAADVKTYNFTGLSAGTAYKFKVVAYYSSYTAAKSVSVTTTPLAPTALKLDSATESSANLSWTASSAASGYYVYVDGEKAATASGTSCTVSIDPSKLHRVSVAAYAENGSIITISDQSDSIPVVLVKKPVVTEYGIYNLSSGYQYYATSWSVTNPNNYNDEYSFFYSDSLDGSEGDLSINSMTFFTKLDETKSITASMDSEGYTNISWDAVDGANGYVVQVCGYNNKDQHKAWVTVFDSANGTDSKDLTSTKIILADNMKYAIRVVVYNRVITLAAYTIDEEENKGALVSNEVSFNVPGKVILSDEYTQVGTYNNTTNMGKTKIVLAAIQAINNTKSETDTVTVNAVTQIDGSMDSSKVIYDGAILKDQEGSIDWLLSIAGGEDLAGDLNASMGDSNSTTGTFTGGSGTVRVTDAEGNTRNVHTTLFDLVTPQARNAYLYNANDVASISKKFSSVSAPVVKDGKTTISFTIAQETANSANPASPVHDGVVEGFSEAVSSMNELDSNSYIKTGATTVTAVINEDGTLDSLHSHSPFEFKMGMDVGGVKILTFTIKSITMILKGNADYNFTFTR